MSLVRGPVESLHDSLLAASLLGGLEMLYDLVQTGNDVRDRPIMGAVVPDESLLAGRLPQRLGHPRRHQLVALAGDLQDPVPLEVRGAGDRVDRRDGRRQLRLAAAEQFVEEAERRR